MPELLHRLEEDLSTRSSDEGRLACELLSLIGEADQSIDADIGHARQCLQRAQHLLSARQSPAITELAPPPPSGSGLAPWQQRRIVQFIEANLHTVIRAEDLASLARLSVSHFSRAFRDSFNQTPYAYVIDRRVERAKAMMAATREPLAQIALSCGMADQAHFSRVFRRLAGESPSRWRRRYGDYPSDDADPADAADEASSIAQTGLLRSATNGSVMSRRSTGRA